MKIGNIFISKMSKSETVMKSKSRSKRSGVRHQLSKAETIHLAEQIFEQSPKRKLIYDESDIYEFSNHNPILGLLKKQFENS
jgi:hypothetical protein